MPIKGQQEKIFFVYSTMANYLSFNEKKSYNLYNSFKNLQVFLRIRIREWKKYFLPFVNFSIQKA